MDRTPVSNNVEHCRHRRYDGLKTDGQWQYRHQSRQRPRNVEPSGARAMPQAVGDYHRDRRSQ